jgi:hypothetical protein
MRTHCNIAVSKSAIIIIILYDYALEIMRCCSSDIDARTTRRKQEKKKKKRYLISRIIGVLEKHVEGVFDFFHRSSV